MRFSSSVASAEGLCLGAIPPIVGVSSKPAVSSKPNLL